MDEAERELAARLAEMEDAARGIRESLGRMQGILNGAAGTRQVRIRLAADGSVELVSLGFDVRRSPEGTITEAIGLALLDAVLVGAVRPGVGRPVPSEATPADVTATDDAHHVTARAIAGRLVSLECDERWVRAVADSAVTAAAALATRRALGLDDDGEVPVVATTTSGQGRTARS